MSKLLARLQKFYIVLELTIVKDQLQTTSWMLVGACIQLLVLTCLSLRTASVLIGTLAAWRLSRTFLTSNGLLPNEEMKNVFVGKSTAMFPQEDGSGGLNPAGRGICVLILGFKVNQYVNPQ